MTAPASALIQQLLTRLQQLQPDTLLHISPTPHAELATALANQGADYQQVSAEQLLHAPQQIAPATLVLVSESLEQLPPSQGRQLLGLLRNYHARHLWVLYRPTANPWVATDFYALALQQEAEFSSEQGSLFWYSYDVHTYNHVRSWNNPKNWANPQNWGKYWW
ncbi:DUF6231 family protein [Balneatrix alpica]|uniref:DUF6231 family protein n=1 Tax=Balneatrix alpica TaxID=75684 RepID=A0ABV5ZFT1_9GAMM|nr:DUF6231 family protein [Balneatrix alpica]